MSLTQSVKFTPSQYQQAIYDCIVNTDKNIVVSATAGAGKTSTLVEASKLIPQGKTSIFAAFNTAIVKELSLRLSENIKCNTLHSIGLTALMSHFRTNFKISEYKSLRFIDDVLKQRISDEKLDEKDLLALKFNMRDAINLVRLTQTPLDEESLFKMCCKYSIELLKRDLTDVIEAMKQLDIYNRSFSKTHNQLDFVDMIYLPISNPKIRIPQYDVVFIDECFPYEQLIITNYGKQKIGIVARWVQEGKNVRAMSFNETKNKFEFKKITNSWNRGLRQVGTVILGGKRKITCTPDHKILSNHGWKSACELEIGDFVISNGLEQPYHRFMNNDQLSICKGGLLGDGSRGRLSRNINRITFIHGLLQEPYLRWKHKILGGTLRQVLENGYSKKPAWTFSTKGFCIDDKELDVENIINNLTPQILAIAWMDDGCLSNKKYGKLFSCATNENNNKLLRLKINEMFGINCQLKTRCSSSTNKPYHCLYFTKDDMVKVQKEIAKYIHPNLSYKVIDEFKNDVGTYIWNNKHMPYGGMVVSKKMELISEKEVFDIEVKDNHNFLITSLYRKPKKSSLDYGFVVHNCQDFNRSMQLFVDRLVAPKGRSIIVGDERQAIYSFSGACTESFQRFQQRPNTVTLPLSISYRCATNIVALARTIYPSIEPNPTNEPGEFRTGKIEEMQDGDMVLCRNNRPLFYLYFELLLQEKRPLLVGKNIQDGLTALIAKCIKKDVESGIEYLNERLDELEADLKERGIKKPKENQKWQDLYDKVKTIDIVSRRFETMKEVNAEIIEMFKEKDKCIKLMTIHGSKGLEADRVFIIERFEGKRLLPSPYAQQEWEHVAEKNLKFVSVTRAKRSLIFIPNLESK